MGPTLAEWSRDFASVFSAHYALRRDMHPYMCLKLAEVSLYTDCGSVDVGHLLDKADSQGVPRTGFVRACILMDNFDSCRDDDDDGDTDPSIAENIKTAAGLLRESADRGCIDSAEALFDLYSEG